MTEISRPRSLMLFFFSISIQLLSGLSDDSHSETDTNVDAQASSKRKYGSRILIICIVVAAIVGFSSFLFKLWQKKKREDQYARLLKLFEQDDEFELELGLRD